VTKNLEESETAFRSEPAVAEPADNARWAFINEWRAEPQANDRTPVRDTDIPSSPSASVRRSMTRRHQQAMFKEWSQGRSE
jgi:hypothetical protein